MRPPPFAHSLTHPIAFATALLGWIVVLAPAPPSSVDVAVPASRSAPVPTAPAPPIESSPSSKPTETVPTRGSDVILEDYPLRTASIRTWRANDHVELPVPDGRTIDLRVERDTRLDGRRHVTLSHDGLVSTFTQSGDRYFGTLATADGVYALDGDEQSARLTRHALLDQRTNPNAEDYRARPSP